MANLEREVKALHGEIDNLKGQIDNLKSQIDRKSDTGEKREKEINLQVEQLIDPEHHHHRPGAGSRGPGEKAEKGEKLQ